MPVMPSSAREDDPQPEDGWTCTTCWTKNAREATKCVRCGWTVPTSTAPAPGKELLSELPIAGEGVAGEGGAGEPGTWEDLDPLKQSSPETMNLIDVLDPARLGRVAGEAIAIAAMVITMLALAALLWLVASPFRQGHVFVVFMAGIGVYYVVKGLLQRR
jgi:hypothetical protein